MRILIVEDERKTAAYVKKGLTEQGYVVDVAHEGLDGLHLASTNNYDLILLDVMLPGIDGWKVLESVRLQKQTPVLFLSALDKVDDRVKGLKLGADDYLVKPFAFSPNCSHGFRTSFAAVRSSRPPCTASPISRSTRSGTACRAAARGSN